MAQVIQEVMHEAGATDFSDDEVYQEFYTGGNVAVVELWHQIITALSPVPKEQKKAVAPEAA